MPEPQPVDNGDLTDYNVLVDDVTDATLGTGAKQLVGLTDGTIGSTTKVAAGGGVEAAALRVTVASDSTGVLSVDDNGSTLSVDDGAGSLTVDNAALAVTGGGVEASALRVTLASDSTGVVSVDDNGGSLTVDGTVGVSGTVAVDSELTTADLDTGAGTDTRAVVGLVKAASGGGVLVSDANPLPISDAGATVSVDDGAGSLTVDAPVGTPVNVKIGDGTNTATVRDLAANDALNVAIVDGSGNQVTSFGGSGGTSMTDDAAFTPASTAITPIGAMFDNVAPDSVDEGDGGVVRMSANRSLYVNIRDNAGNERGLNIDAAGALAVTDGGGSLTVDGSVSLAAAIPAGTNNIGDVDVLTLPNVTLAAGTNTNEVVGDAAHDAAVAGNPLLVGFEAKDQDGAALPNAVSAEGDVVRAAASLSGVQYVMPVNEDGSAVATVTVQDGGGSITVDGSVTAVASGDHTVIGKAADGAAVSGNPVLIAGQDGTNVQSLKTDAAGELQVDVLTMPTVTVTDGLNVEGDVAHDGADSGNPVKVGAKAVAHGANPTAVAAADRTDLYANRHGVQWTIGGHPNAKSATYITTAAGTDDNVMAAIAGGTKYAVTRITITLDEATTVGVGVRLGFGTASVPALGASQADAVDDILVYHPGLVPGGGITIGDGSGVLGVGGDGAELRITNEVPTSGTLAVTVTYFTIES